MRKSKYIALTALMLCALLALTGCQSASVATPTKNPDAANPTAVIEMDSGAKINLTLLPEYAPNTVANFIELANAGFYDGLTFHRVVADFVIQTGNAETASSPKDGANYTIKGEMSANGFKQNTLKHVKGVVSMARVGNDYNSGSSQFFITVAEAPTYLDGEYAAFGVVADDESMAAVEKISKVAVTTQDVPINEQRIKSIRVDTHGETYTVEKIAG